MGSVLGSTTCSWRPDPLRHPPRSGRTLSRSVDTGMLTSQVVRDGDDAGDDAFGDMSCGGDLTKFVRHLDGIAILDTARGGEIWR